MAAIGAIVRVHVIVAATMIRTAVKTHSRHHAHLKTVVVAAVMRWHSRAVLQDLETTIPADARRKRVKNSLRSAGAQQCCALIAIIMEHRTWKSAMRISGKK